MKWIRKIKWHVCVFGGGVVKRDDQATETMMNVMWHEWTTHHLTMLNKQTKTLRTQASLCVSPDMCSQWLTRGVLLTFKAVCTSESHERKKINKERRGRGKVSSLLDVTFDNFKYNILPLPGKNSQNQQPRIHNETANYICLKVKREPSQNLRAVTTTKICSNHFYNL